MFSTQLTYFETRWRQIKYFFGIRKENTTKQTMRSRTYTRTNTQSIHYDWSHQKTEQMVCKKIHWNVIDDKWDLNVHGVHFYKEKRNNKMGKNHCKKNRLNWGHFLPKREFHSFLVIIKSVFICWKLRTLSAFF